MPFGGSLYYIPDLHVPTVVSVMQSTRFDGSTELVTAQEVELEKRKNKPAQHFLAPAA